MTEEVVNVPEKLNEIGHKIGQYNDMIVKDSKTWKSRLNAGMLMLQNQKKNTL